jgi:3-oxoacyl-ACP reductase-like protein
MVGVALAALAGCTTAGTPAPAPAPAPAPPPTAAPTTATAAPDPVGFFRAQEESCKQFAAQQGIAPVEDERFRDAKVVRDLGGGTTEIEDGHGTHLVVDPARGIVLPASGKPTDVMPPPYGFTCSEKVFVGAAAD